MQLLIISLTLPKLVILCTRMYYVCVCGRLVMVRYIENGNNKTTANSRRAHVGSTLAQYENNVRHCKNARVHTRTGWGHLFHTALGCCHTRLGARRPNFFSDVCTVAPSVSKTADKGKKNISLVESEISRVRNVRVFHDR